MKVCCKLAVISSKIQMLNWQWLAVKVNEAIVSMMLMMILAEPTAKIIPAFHKLYSSKGKSCHSLWYKQA